MKISREQFIQKWKEQGISWTRIDVDEDWVDFSEIKIDRSFYSHVDKRIISAIEEQSWDEYGVTIGNPVYIPVHILKLFSPESNIREEGWEGIYGQLVHQGYISSLDSGIVPVVEIFFQMLKYQRDLPGKDKLLHFIGFATDSEFINFLPEGFSLKRLEEELLFIHQEVYQYMLKNQALVIDFIENDADKKVKLEAIYALSFLGDEGKALRSHILRWIAKYREDADLLAALLITLGFFDGINGLKSGITFLQQFLKNDQPITVRIAAALALSNIQKKAVGRQAIEQLSEVHKYFYPRATSMWSLPWSLTSAATLTLESLGGRTAEIVLEKIQEAPQLLQADEQIAAKAPN